MGNCCSDDSGGRLAVSGASASRNNQSDAPMTAFNYSLHSRGYNGLSSQIQLALSASSLQDPDVISKRDPMAVVYTQKRDGTLEELGRTEVLLNTLNPVWITKHNITYHFEFVQTLVFRLFDVDTHCQNVGVKIIKLEEQHFLGEATCALSEIVTKSSRSLTLPLVQEEKSTRSTCSSYFGQLTVQAEECFSSKTMTELIFRCSDLENKDLFSRSDTFLVISKTLGNGISSLICKTEVRKNDLEPTWEPVYLNIQQVGSKDSPLDLECYNFNNSGKHVLIGKLHKSLAQLEKLFSSKQGENLFLPTTIGHTYHNKELKSKLFVDKFSESVQHTFLDYLAAGCELNFMVAIDFTASNGNPRLPDSLHYIDPSGRPNAYQRAIFEVGEVLQFYDSDERFPAWGFGARPIDGPVSHCFNLNGSSNYCEVEGIQGILMAYASALFNVSLAGPTLFGQVISTAAEIASQSLSNGQQKYSVFLIITDGVITDLHETKDAIVNASDLPLSIFIVGVGGADFKEMDIFDAVKGERLESTTGRVASRNIVQFVALRDVQDGDVSVQSLLADLPAQFLTYMRTRDTRLNS